MKPFQANGIGLAFRHCQGMYGMRFPGYIVWSLPIVALSVLIALWAASAAPWHSFRTGPSELQALPPAGPP